MFALPQGNDLKAKGTSEEEPIRLEGIKSEEFKSFLKLLYPLKYVSR